MATTISLSSITAQNIQLAAGQQIASQPLGVQSYSGTGAGQTVTTNDPGYTLGTSSTNPGQQTIDYISNMSVSSYMRPIQVDFFAYNLRPNRRLYPFFSDVNVTRLIQRPNIIELDNDVVYYSILPRTSSALGTLNNNIDPNHVVNDKIITMVSDGNGGFTEVVTTVCPGDISGQVDTSRERIRIGTSVADVYFTERANTGRTILYVSNFVDESGNNECIVEIGNTVTGVKSGSFANIVSYNHSTGVIRIPIENDYQANTVGAANATFVHANLRLSQDASSTEDYTGRTLTLVNGGIPGETVMITSYDANTKVVTVSPGVKGIAKYQDWSQIYYSIGDKRVPYVDEYTDPGMFSTTKGFFAGTLFIPGAGVQSPYMFRTGEKLFKISDDSGAKSTDATTIAEYIFNAYGMDISRGQIIINNPDANTVQSLSGTLKPLSTMDAPPLTPPVVVNDPITANAVSALAGTNSVRRNNPIAQSFYISDIDYPKGIYVPYVDLFFAEKGTLPIELQIRPLNKGFPDPKNIVPNAIAVVEAEEVKTSSKPDTANSNTYTRFTFTSPVYLLPDQDYALVVSSNDYDYTIYISELGEKIIGSDRIVSQQPYLGTLFRSQNSATYDTINSEDMMFVIHKCEFVSEGSIEFYEQKSDNWQYLQTLTTVSPNSAFDSFSVNSDIGEVNGTKILYEYRATTLGGSMDTNYTEFRPGILTPMDERKVLNAVQYPDVSFKMKLNLSTLSKDVSPIVFKEKQNLSTAATIINNLELDPTRLIVANTGSGYTFQNTSVAINSTVGSGANAEIIRMFEQLPANTNSSGKIATLYFNSFGSGYAEDVDIVLTSSDGSNAEILVTSETGKSGGPALARYISKIVTLAQEFNAGDLRVYLTAIRPQNTNIYVYYKVRNNYDNDDISEKSWVRMVERPTSGTQSYAYSVLGKPVELEFRPSLTSNNIVYSSNTATFDTFNQFKIKIVLASTDTVLTKIPYVYDMRAIALPGDVK